MTVLSCPFLLQISYQKLPKEANSSTERSRVCAFTVFVEHSLLQELSSWASLPSTLKTILVPLSCHLAGIWIGTSELQMES